tara:strand:- start:232 stop:558 length:327 start_codon:yes stop_codon:yes gene_type:complete
MKSKLEIECALVEEIQHRDDPHHPMDEMEWAHNQGWIEALEWVLKREQMRGDSKDINHILEGANDETITKALKRLSEDCGFGRGDNVIDSKTDSIYNNRIEQYKQCAP